MLLILLDGPRLLGLGSDSELLVVGGFVGVPPAKIGLPVIHHVEHSAGAMVADVALERPHP